MKTAIVTGAGGGIGSAIAIQLARDGMFVILVGRSDASLSNVATHLNTFSGVAVNYEKGLVDITDPVAVENFWWSPAHRYVDILVNCAAAPAVITPITETSYEDWMQTIQTDLTGTFLMCKGAARAMKLACKGRIINLASYHVLGSYPNRSAYAAAKGGVLALTRQLAVELGLYGITVNAVSPGAIRTARTSAFLATHPNLGQRLVERTPTGRLGTVEDVANVVAWLASDKASHITGQNIVIDGGFSVNFNPVS